MQTTTLMRCGKGHPRTYDVPAEATIDSSIFGFVSVAGQPLRCTLDGCRRQYRTITIEAIANGKPCGAICRNATGATCKCSCGARNHGKDAEA